MTTAAAVPSDSCPTEDALLGRGRELAALNRALVTHRLVALTGPAGVGKTRLAAAAAMTAPQLRPCRVLRVDLSGLLAPELFSSTLGYVLDIRADGTGSELGALARGLATEPTLLVLDGCERMRGHAAGAVEYLIDSCPELVVLAVGRATPGSRYERIHRLDPLAEGPAIALLSARARQFGAPAFARGGHEHLDALPLCHLLDRNPLAIELAAGRLTGQSPRQLMSEVSRPAGLLGLGPVALPPGRLPDGTVNYARQLPNRTLRAAAESSLDLCTDAERLLWARLSAVPVGFDLAEAQQACAGPDLSVFALEQAWCGLIRSSVLVPYGAGAQRYRLPFLLRALGREQLRQLSR
jgi:predicted ATPase